MLDKRDLLTEDTVRLISHVQLEGIVGSKMAAGMLQQHSSHGHARVSPRHSHHYSSEHPKHSHQQSNGYSNNSHQQSNGYTNHLSHSGAKEPERHRGTHRQSNGHNNHSHHHSNGHSNHFPKENSLKPQARSKSEVRETTSKTGLSHSAAPKLENLPRSSGGVPRLPHRDTNHSHQQNNRHTDSSAHRHGHGSQNHSHRQSNGHDNHFRGDGHTNYSPQHGNANSNHSHRQSDDHSNHHHPQSNGYSNHPHQRSDGHNRHLSKKPSRHSSAHRPSNGNANHSAKETALKPEKARPKPTSLCLKCRDFTVPDQHAARFPRQSNSDIRKLAIDLTSPFPDVIDKTRALFTWMHHNIVYDDDDYAQRSIEETLRSGRAVCSGYAGLFTQMASFVGIESVDVSGYGHGDKYSPAKDQVSAFKSNHAWNAVKFPQGWHLIDCTWGAGGSTNGCKWEKRFKPYHFTQTPEEFRRRHFPENPKHQYCRDIMTWKEFIRIDEPDICAIFTNPIVDFSPHTLEPAHRLLKPNTQYRFRLTRSCKHQDKTKVKVVLIGVKGYKWKVLESDSHGGMVSTGTTGPTGTTVSLQLVTKYEGTQNGGYSMERDVLCIWTVA